MNQNPIEQFSHIVYKIITPEGSGSGFYYKDYNVIITNFHVVKGFRKVGIEDIDKNSFSADVVMVNPALDLAFLKPNKEILDDTSIDFIPSDKLQVGQKVKVLGYPFGMPFTITEGIISSTKQLVNDRNFIQTDAAVNPGNSGGPIINEEFKIIGVTVLKFKEAENVAFAIPVEYILEDLKDYIKNKDYIYTIKCPSCFSPITEPIEYCSHCGQELKDIQKYFEFGQKNELETFIENVLNQLNIDPVAAQKEKEFWEFYYGSSLIRFFSYKKNYYIATSPLVRLPTENIESFYEFILSNPYPPFVFGIYKNKLYLSYRIRKEDFNELNKTYIEKHLIDFIQKVDYLDHYFVETYHCQLAEESKNSSNF
ncbi:MAG: protease [Leptospiraceae bacterium]|nr:MAG: protease [Leptospiraceae bacterium]